MPSLFSIFGYKVYFWSNENGEPVHVHICKGNPKSNATKVWLTSSSGAILANNSSKIPNKDLNKILKFIALNHNNICIEWNNRFGYISFYA